MSEGLSGRRIDLVALDLDGVVWRGRELLPGVREALAEVVARGLDLRYVTNNSTAHREEVSQRLAALGLPAGQERVITSGSVTAHWLKDRLPMGAPVYVIGEGGLLRELREVGLSPRRTAGGAVAAVVVGMDRGFCYRTLMEAQAALLHEDVLFVATNRDNTFPTAEGLRPGAGSLVAAVAAAAGREPVVMGKPGPALAEVLASMSAVAPARTLFIGDRLTTDIAMGRVVGMVTALVLTGVTSRADLERLQAGGAEATEDVPLPDFVLDGLADLPGLLDTFVEAPEEGRPRGPEEAGRRALD